MSEKQEWEQREDNDDFLIDTDDLTTEIYIPKGTNNPTLTHVGLAKIANKERITVIDVKEREIYKFQFDKDGNKVQTLDGILMIATGKNREGDQRWAAHFQPVSAKNPHFDWAKAFSKVQRNLFKIFLYGHQTVEETIDKWRAKKGQAQQPATQQPPAQQQQPTQQKETPVSSLDQAKNGARNSLQAEPTLKVLEELGIPKTSDLHKIAQDLWGPEADWDVVKWKRYNNEILNLRKKKGLLWDKIKPAEESKPEQPATANGTPETAQEIHF